MDDRGFVAAQDAEPMPDIACMAIMQDIGQAQVRAAETGSDLGHKFLETIGLIAEALAEGARESARMA